MRNIQPHSHQRGGSYLGIFFGIVLAAFAIKLAASLIPAFIDDRLVNNQIQEALTSLPPNTTVRQFKDDLSRRFDMNNIRELKIDDIIQVTAVSGLSVKKEYQVHSPFFGNVELVTTFKKDFDQKTAKGGQ